MKGSEYLAEPSLSSAVLFDAYTVGRPEVSLAPYMYDTVLAPMSRPDDVEHWTTTFETRT